MCGRFAIHSKQTDIEAHFGLARSEKFIQRYNVAPGTDIPVIRLQDNERELANCHWGLIPHWARDTKLQPINARAETITEKPFFKSVLKTKRCLIPANGFYEWKAVGGKKQPYYFQIKGGELFAFAGLWDRWQHEDTTIESCTIITTDANASMNPIHHRMPVILKPDDYEEWLAMPSIDLLVPYRDKLNCYPVSTDVNNPENNSRGLIQPVAGYN